jgi:hypothetical protein
MSIRVPSSANMSRVDVVLCDEPRSIKRKNNQLSFASFRQIFTRIKKSFLLKASSASIQFAATEPDARTNCRTSSMLLIVFGASRTRARVLQIETSDLLDHVVWYDLPFES